VPLWQILKKTATYNGRLQISAFMADTEKDDDKYIRCAFMADYD
jgi:hypothetical protein